MILINSHKTYNFLFNRLVSQKIIACEDFPNCENKLLKVCG